MHHCLLIASSKGQELADQLKPFNDGSNMDDSEKEESPYFEFEPDEKIPESGYVEGWIQDGYIGYWTNPRSNTWDYWQVGGRWGSRLVLIKGNQGATGCGYCIGQGVLWSSNPEYHTSFLKGNDEPKRISKPCDKCDGRGDFPATDFADTAIVRNVNWHATFERAKAMAAVRFTSDDIFNRPREGETLSKYTDRNRLMYAFHAILLPDGGMYGPGHMVMGKDDWWDVQQGWIAQFEPEWELTVVDCHV